MEISIKSEYGTEINIKVSKDADLPTIIDALRALLIGVGYSPELVSEHIKTE